MAAASFGSALAAQGITAQQYRKTIKNVAASETRYQ